MNKNYTIHTYGCKVNTYDTGLLQGQLEKDGYIPFSQSASTAVTPMTSKVHILNTCAVTAEATKEALKRVKKLKASDPACTVVITGCGAQVDTEHFSNLPGVDLVIANSHKSQLPQILDQYFRGEIPSKVFKANIFKKEELEEGGGIETAHTRSFLKIQDGCNSFCTYCVIPYARGKSRSLSLENLVNRVEQINAQGVKEIVLTGVHIGDWEDSGKGLEDLIENILTKTNIQRIRLTSLEPLELSERLIELYKDSRLCPHFHMSIQSANSEVLKNMRRKYDQKAVITSLEKIKTNLPQAFVGMDVIVGFPAESHEQFEDTYFTLSNLPWNKIHVFPYSERGGTRALQIEPKVSEREKQIRSSRLRSLSLERYQKTALEQVGTVKDVLLLGNQGLTQDFWSVDVQGEKGKIVLMKLNEYVNPEKTEGWFKGQIL